MHSARAIFMALALLAGLTLPAEASSLRVAPISLKLAAQEPSGVVRVWNDGAEPVQVQVRVFRWRVVNGQDVLEPTTDVVASPPMTTLVPGAENLIRVVRVSKRPLAEKEAYRLLVDELPNPAKQRAGTVTVLVRHAIPVVFSN
jgi:fimbrial chaperone protein